MEASEALALIQSADQIWFSNHARDRMRERGVSRHDVLHCIKHASSIVADEEGEGWCLTGSDLEDDSLTVVIAVELRLVGGARNVVITVY